MNNHKERPACYRSDYTQEPPCRAHGTPPNISQMFELTSGCEDCYRLKKAVHESLMHPCRDVMLTTTESDNGNT